MATSGKCDRVNSLPPIMGTPNASKRGSLEAFGFSFDGKKNRSCFELLVSVLSAIFQNTSLTGGCMCSLVYSIITWALIDYLEYLKSR